MKIFIMTDLEGVAGVLNGRDWLYPEGRHYNAARRLLTQQVNAAVDGLAGGGFTEFVVADGHGAGGIDVERLHPRAMLARGWGRRPYPFGLDRSFRAVAYVGQHAKAGTPFSHLTHTGWFSVQDQQLNGVSIGEYGEGAFSAGELDVPLIFATGDRAFCKEAEALTPWVVTAETLCGAIDGAGEGLSTEDYEHFHEGAVHLSPPRACELIRRKAQEAACAFRDDPKRFQPLKLPAPYHLRRVLRSRQGKEGGVVEYRHESSIIELLNSVTQ